MLYRMDIHKGIPSDGQKEEPVIMINSSIKDIYVYLRRTVLCLSVFLFIGLVLVPPRIISATTDEGLSFRDKPLIIKKIAFLPLDNLSANPRAGKVVTEAIKGKLREKGWLFIADDREVERFLAKRRIRYTGAITRVVAREMGKVLGVDAVMVGSINLFSEKKDDVVLGVTVRLVSTLDGSILWSDNLSYTGRDFEGILGLGIIKNMDTLASVLAENLMGSVPVNYFVEGKGLSPFEIEWMNTAPSVGKGGEKIRVVIKVLSITEEPERIKVVLGDKETFLSRDEGNVYEGFIEAPEEEGLYTVDVIAFDRTTKPYTFSAVGEIRVDTTPPDVTVTLNRDVFAPRKKGFVTFIPRLNNYDDVDEWTIEILNEQGKVVRSDKGYGKLPRGLIWKGESNSFHIMGDGEYTYRFRVKDLAGNETTVTGKVKIKNKPPDIKVNIEVDENKIIFILDKDKEEKIESWKFSLLNKKGKVIRAMEGKGELPPRVEIDMDEGFDINKMAFSITATDVAGNPFTLRKSIPSVLFKKTPFARLKKKNQFVEDF